ncbi:MAG: response regulator [Chitinispirillaceae bacterium]|nr:response regulator [Chitinispirillaceae bacterium]
MAHQKDQCGVLIVDDDPLLCNTIEQFLSREGITATCASNGKKALELFLSEKPQAIVADLCMPVMDGLELLENVNKTGLPVPVIITTGNPDMQSAIKALQQGAYDYLLKPVNLPVLLQKIRRAIEKTQLTSQNSLLSEMVSLYAMTSKLAATHNVDALLDVIFKHGLEITDSPQGVIFLNEGQGNELVYGRQKGYAAGSANDSDAETVRCLIAQRSFEIRETLVVENGVLHKGEKIHDGCKNIHSLIAVPLCIQKKVIGTFIVERDAVAVPYSALDVNRMEILASQAGIALNNATLYTSLNQKVEELKLVGTFSEQLMGRTDRIDLIKSLFEKTREHCAPDFIAFLLTEHRQNEFLYWSRGAMDEVDVWQVYRTVADAGERKTGGKIDERKVSLRRIFPSQKANCRVKPPFGLEHVSTIQWEGTTLGVFYLGSVMKRQEFLESDALISGLVNQVRISLINAKLYNDMKVNYLRTIKALAIAVDAKDKYTLGHSEKVMLLAEELAREIQGFDIRRVAVIRDAALLHDIGKIGIPGTILNKPGPLSYDEFNGVMKSHSTLGANIVKDVPFLSELYKLILHHHEHYDGTGYPGGLKGEDIPLGARILHIADAFDAMTSDRPYRSSLGHHEAIRRIVADSGKHFDPVLVGIFLRVARKKGIID